MLFARTTAELTINDDDDDDDDDDAQYNMKRFFLSDTKLELQIFEFHHENDTNNTQQHKKQLYKTHIKNPRQTDGNTRVNERCDGIREAGER